MATDDVIALQTIAKVVHQTLDRDTFLPKPVRDMTADERVMLTQLAAYSGTMQFIQGIVDSRVVAHEIAARNSPEIAASVQKAMDRFYAKMAEMQPNICLSPKAIRFLRSAINSLRIGMMTTIGDKEATSEDEAASLVNDLGYLNAIDHDLEALHDRLIGAAGPPA